MNNGNYNGYDPNRSGQGNGYNSNYDPNAAYGNNYYPNGYSSGGYQQGASYDNSTSQGYRPYEGGTYGDPNSGTSPYGANQNSAYSSPYGNTAQNYGASYNTGAYSPTMTMADYSRRIFGWMGAGLTLTFVIAFAMMVFLTSGTYEETYNKIVDFIPVFYVGIGVEIILAIVLSFFVRKLPSSVSLVLFVVYSVCNGVTITPMLVLYGAETAVYAFAAAAVLFISFAIYGMVTKRDLSKLGPILMIGLFVLIGYSLLAMLFGMSPNSLIISLIGIAIFIGFTAYDTRKIKTGYEQFGSDEEMLRKSAVNLALELYLDFINLFIYLLRLMGSRR